MTSSTVVDAPKPAPISDWTLLSFSVLGIVLLFVCTLAGGWIVKLQMDRDVYRTIVAGASKAQVEAEFGKPRFASAPGRPLTDVRWNGAEKDTLSKFGLSVYHASLFMFVVCEFDENDHLIRATISPI